MATEDPPKYKSLSPEEEPLLAPSQENLRETTNYAGQDVDVENQPEALPESKRSVWEVAFYVILVLVCAALLAMLVKGFIDADDVDVRGTSACQDCEILIQAIPFPVV